MDVRVEGLAKGHDGLVTWAGLRAAGMTEEETRWAVAQLRRLHDGVFLTGHGRLTDHQRRLAATLTAPRTVLSHASAAALQGFRPALRAAFEVVTRPGSGGPRRIGGLLVCRSTTLADTDIVVRDGIPVTSPTRTLVDLSPHLGPRARAKAIREGIRLGAFTALELRLAAAKHRGRRGVAGLSDLARQLERLPISRTRSDAEARALEVLATAGLPLPVVNVVYEGEEADLSWPQHRSIIEIDGPQFHQDAAEDARKERCWREQGWRVDRISSDTVFDAPQALITLASSSASAPPAGSNVHAPLS